MATLVLRAVRSGLPRSGRRAFHDVTSTSQLLNRHPAVSSAVAWKKDPLSSTINLLAIACPKRGAVSVGTLREHLHDRGFTGCLKDVEYVAMDDILKVDRRMASQDQGSTEENERVAALLHLKEDGLRIHLRK